MAETPDTPSAPPRLRSEGDVLTFWYTNHEGKKSLRRVVPIHVYFGSTEWHPEQQYLLRAFDLDKLAMRDFAVVDMVPVPVRAHTEALLELVGALSACFPDGQGLPPETYARLLAAHGAAARALKATGDSLIGR